ncbi:hypothetical protein [Nocardia niigatensis]|nr:hypothetical protein [Nocardia niigatensis]
MEFNREDFRLENPHFDFDNAVDASAVPKLPTCDEPTGPKRQFDGAPPA